MVLGARRSQAAEVARPTGRCEGDGDNRHQGADQWLYVDSGTGVATVDKRCHPLKGGVLPLIEEGDEDGIPNTGRGLPRTLSFYVPPAYDGDGDELSRGKR